MDKAIYFLGLSSVIPIVGAFVGKRTVIGSAVLAWGIFLTGFIFFDHEEGRIFLINQLPLMVFMTALGVYVARFSSGQFGIPALEEEKTRFQELQSRHKQLKDIVSGIEKVEVSSQQIYAVAKGLGEALSWKDMAPRLTNGIQKIFGAYEFLLYAIDEKNQWVQLHRRGSWTKEPPISGEIPGKSQFVHPPHVEEVVPVLSVPIYSLGEGDRDMKGALFIKYSGGQTESELVASGEEFSEQLSMALNKALLFSKMETSSRVDGLTGVLRRQAFMDRLAEELKRAAVFHTPFSVMMVDIDHFKAVNDSHGHGAGDAVLMRVGDVLKNSVYETDVVGRYGGEEFIVLLPKAQPDGVMRKAEALRKRIEQETIASGFERLHVTVSIGVAHFPSHGVAADVLIAGADKALYRAKDTGRNRVIEAT